MFSPAFGGAFFLGLDLKFHYGSPAFSHYLIVEGGIPAVSSKTPKNAKHFWVEESSYGEILSPQLY